MFTWIEEISSNKSVKVTKNRYNRYPAGVAWGDDINFPKHIEQFHVQIYVRSFVAANLHRRKLKSYRDDLDFPSNLASF